MDPRRRRPVPARRCRVRCRLLRRKDAGHQRCENDRGKANCHDMPRGTYDRFALIHLILSRSILLYAAPATFQPALTPALSLRELRYLDILLRLPLLIPSPPRRRGPRSREGCPGRPEIPAFAGMTNEQDMSIPWAREAGG